MGSVKALDQGTIHRICSGQVIINLANAVKELVENSLDAGARTVEIRLRNYGSEMIECIDDGPGIPEADFQTITLKHYTSKIENYDDLESLDTFGFRGEALSSLCALSNLTITTRHAASQCAYRLEYDKNGLIKSKTQCARAIGTTVTLEKLFHTLPVRHKEFTKNLKREYHKLMSLIQCYCLISDGVKLSCYHSTSSDKSSTKLMATHSKNSLKENIIEIFGLSSFQQLIKIEQVVPDEDQLAEFKINMSPERVDEELSKMFRLEGFVSSCSHGMGRAAPDRQYIYVNKRPCDNTRIVKLVNEVFHQFNRTQYPMLVLNVSMEGSFVDVNVTPDKLQMFIKNENYLLAIIKASLAKMYNKIFKSLNIENSSFHNSEKSAALMASFCSTSSSSSDVSSPRLNSTRLNETLSDKPSEKSSLNDITEINSVASPNSTLVKSPVPSALDILKQTQIQIAKENKRPREFEPSENDESLINEEYSAKQPKQVKLTSFLNPSSKISPSKSPIASPKPPRARVSPPAKLTNLSSNQMTFGQRLASPFSMNDKKSFFHNQIGGSSNSLNNSIADRMDLHMCERVSTPPPVKPKKKQVDEDEEEIVYERPTTRSNQKSIQDHLKQLGLTANTMLEDTNLIDQEADKTQLPENTQIINSTLNETFSTRKNKQISVDWNRLKSKHDKMIEKLVRNEENNEKEMLSGLKFKTKNMESKEAENELDKCITQEDFLRMKVIGQFNKGFIIAQLEEDLFIVDQHAADEIYNFESLQRGGKVDKQKLLQPRYLELTPSSEAILIDNLPLVEKLGYDMQICQNRKMGNRLMITSVPMAKQTSKLLNLKDIDELLFILSEHGGELHSGSISVSSLEQQQSNLADVKSSSLRAIFASKACRKSIMIGDSLNQSEMKRVLAHLNEIEKPWNCPHGRPTMRHLINLDLLRRSKRFQQKL